MRRSSSRPPCSRDKTSTQIDYDDYINVSSASVFISQLTGGSTADIHFSFWEAGGGGTDKAPTDLLPEEGYSDVAGQSDSYIGNQDTDSHLTDDTEVAIASVTIGGFTWDAMQQRHTIRAASRSRSTETT